jgi:hypothetical protein
MADIAEAKVELQLGEIRNRAKDIADELKAGNDWSVPFALKVRKIGKLFEAAGDPSIADINEESEARDKAYQKAIGELQEKYVVRGVDNAPVLNDQNRFTFKDEIEKGEYFEQVKELNKAYNKAYEELDNVLKQKVDITALVVPKAVQPEKISGKLLTAIAEFLEE